MFANWPDEAPESEADEGNIDDEEPTLEVLRDQTTHEVGGRKDIVEPANVLLDGVGGLRADKSKKRPLQALHDARQPPNESRISCVVWRPPQAASFKRWLDGNEEMGSWSSSALTKSRKPPPADLRKVRSVGRIFPQEVLFNEASQHERNNEGDGDGKVQRRKGAQNEGEK
jgi:hypothetical protein